MATQPAVTTVEFDDLKFLAFATEFNLFTPHNGTGIPLMGANEYAIQVSVDMHDTKNVPFSTVQKLFDHAHTLTSDKVKQCKLTYWADETCKDALATLSFEGWIAHLAIMSGEGTNHLLILKLQPKLGEQHFVKMTMGN